MIQFEHMGEQRFANVFASHLNPTIDVYLLDLQSRNEQKITLNRTHLGCSVVKTTVPIHEELLEIIIFTIEQHLSS
jgi:hypothetical protein